MDKTELLGKLAFEQFKTQSDYLADKIKQNSFSLGNSKMDSYSPTKMNSAKFSMSAGEP